MIFWEPIIWNNDLLWLLGDFDIQQQEKIFDLFFIGYSIFFIGSLGLFLPYFSILYMLFCIELIFLGINLVFLALGYLYSIIYMPIIVLMILTLSAAETAVVLAIIIVYHRSLQTISLVPLKKLQY